MCLILGSLLASILLVGCASVPDPEPRFKMYELSNVEPLDLSLLPAPIKVEVDGQPMYAFTADQFADLDAWTEGQAKITKQLLLERQHLVQAGALTEERLGNRVGELNQERQEHALDVWFYRIILTAVTVAALL